MRFYLCLSSSDNHLLLKKEPETYIIEYGSSKFHSAIIYSTVLIIMAVSAKGFSMWLICRKPVNNITSNVLSVLRRSCHLQQRQNYYGTSSVRNQCTSTAEKSKNTESSQSDEASADTKVEELSPKEKELLAENEKLLESVRDLNDKYKRALAENENVRRRMRREISDAKEYGIQNFVKDLLEVADVLGKATETVPQEALQSNNHLKTLYEGLQMTEAQLQSVFKRYGVTQINPIGEKFNPHHHEALFELEDSSKEGGTVGAVTKIGYKLHERVVRPAMVGVVKTS